MNTTALLRQIKADIRPSEKERKTIEKLARAVLNKIKLPKAEAVIGGSFAKDTWMKNTRDVDIYVRFDYKTYNDRSGQISDILESALKKHFRVVRLHGSRDYFQLKRKAYTFEIVPILAIKKPEEALNITDFSSFHVTHVRKHRRLADEIRLAKAFAKAHDAYGAESYIRGFSGYALELLVIKHGSFLRLVNAASQWKPKVIIGDKRMAEKLSWAKKVSPLILLDPVQPDRNAAAALSEEKFWAFVTACKRFLQQPSAEFFVQKPVDVEALRERGIVVIVKAVPLRRKEDVAGAKALKAFHFLRKQMTLHEFLLHDSFFAHGHLTTFYFVVDSRPLSEYVAVVGPPVAYKEHFRAFLQKHPQADIEGQRAAAHVRREFRTIHEFIKSLLKHEEVRSRVTSASYEILEQKRSKEAA